MLVYTYAHACALQATKVALQLEERYGAPVDPTTDVWAMVDGQDVPEDIIGEGIHGGDRTELCIAAASLFAKVTRDALMFEEHEKWPKYGFNMHKGYGTRVHLDQIAARGPCPLHRLSLSPFTARTGRRVNVASSRKVYERIQRKLKGKGMPRSAPTGVELPQRDEVQHSLKMFHTSKRGKRRARHQA